VTVAYLGGSITAMNGWRNKTTDWLRTTYPGATFKEIHAAIGGTGSDLGVFRLGRDVLAHKPDLLFVEFATNDGGQPPEQIWAQYGGHRAADVAAGSGHGHHLHVHHHNGVHERLLPRNVQTVRHRRWSCWRITTEFLRSISVSV
jgi:lysophospholipase L1-like esterase